MYLLLRVCHGVCSDDTPLHDSVSYGSVHVCELLLKSGADVNAKNS